MTFSTSILSTGQNATPTVYDRFKTWATSQGYPVANDNDAPRNNADYSQRRVINMFNGAMGTMWGSPWNANFTDDSTWARAIQHAMPNQSVFDDQSLNSRVVVSSLVFVGNVQTYALDRNGYASLPYPAFPSVQMTEVIYWDPNLSKVMRSVPYTAQTPVEFTGF